MSPCPPTLGYTRVGIQVEAKKDPDRSLSKKAMIRDELLRAKEKEKQCGVVERALVGE